MPAILIYGHHVRISGDTPAKQSALTGAAYPFDRLDHIGEARFYLFPFPGFESAVGVDPELLFWQDLQQSVDLIDHLLYRRDARGVDVVDAGADLLLVADLLEDTQQRVSAAGRLYRDDVGIHRLDGVDDVVELAVAHMRVDLRLAAGAGHAAAEGIDGPRLVRGDVFATQRIALLEGRLVHLDDADARVLQVVDLVADGQCDLCGDVGAGEIVAHERPVEDRDGAGKHPLEKEDCPLFS